MSIGRKKSRRQSGRIREKAGDREHWAEKKAGDKADESEKKQEIVSTGQKKSRRRSGRIREKAGDREHRAEEKPETKRTNQRKSRRSWALSRKKAGDKADEPEKKQEIVSIGQQSWHISYRIICQDTFSKEKIVLYSSAKAMIPIKQKTQTIKVWVSRAEEETWTLTVLLPHGPEPCASANSTTSAKLPE